MICDPCNDNRHDQCDDIIRQENFKAWLASLPFGDIILGETERRIIKANRPYDSCPCQHKGEPPVEAHHPACVKYGDDSQCVPCNV